MTKMRRKKTAVIIGAGPAGLTAAYELLQKTDLKPVVIESTNYIGGLSKTVNHNGNKIDIGGHRFFSKSDKVMDWWLNILPLEKVDEFRNEIVLKYKGKERDLPKKINQHQDGEMLVRSRKSRILYGGKFFDYPITLSLDTLKKLGIIKVIKIGNSYIYAKILPKKPEDNLENFFINRFGEALYRTFFKEYTEKVWGVKCNQISAEWGAQRIKSLSVGRAIVHALKPKKSDITQKKTETSLIEHFLYPKYGPGQMWETVAEEVAKHGGKIIKNAYVTSISLNNGTASTVTYKKGSKTVTKQADYVISTMPVNELVASLKGVTVPKKVSDVAEGLMFRDFITVGVLLDDVNQESLNDIDDNWIYIQEPHVKVGRVQIFNNWSPYLVQDKSKLWVGLEYFVNETDRFWKKTDKQLKKIAEKELQSLGIFPNQKVVDSVVIREKKAYPAYFGSYNKINVIQKFTDSIPNLFLIGRNGMHRYNNQDHSMLAAMKAVEIIKNGSTNKKSLWTINLEETYQESK